MFKILNSVVIAEFTLSAAGPVLVSSHGGNEIDPTLPDSTFLMGSTETGMAYVIPGSSIKGVIRNRYCDIICDENSVKKLFGYIDNTNKIVQRSKVSFHDAYADMDTVRVLTRYSTAIDSAIQGAKRNSLNNVQVVEKGDFMAGFKAVNCDYKEIRLLLKIIDDVNSGLVRFGGRKSRGFGAMTVTSFKLTVKKGLDENFNEKVEQVFDSLDEALAAYSARRSE